MKLITASEEGFKVCTAGDRDDRGDDVVDEHRLSCPRVWPSPATGGVVVGCSRRLRIFLLEFDKIDFCRPLADKCFLWLFRQ